MLVYFARSLLFTHAHGESSVAAALRLCSNLQTILTKCLLGPARQRVSPRLHFGSARRVWPHRKVAPAEPRATNLHLAYVNQGAALTVLSDHLEARARDDASISMFA